MCLHLQSEFQYDDSLLRSDFFTLKAERSKTSKIGSSELQRFISVGLQITFHIRQQNKLNLLLCREQYFMQNLQKNYFIQTTLSQKNS